MRRLLLTSKLLTILLAVSAFAEIPSLINYQGRLTDSGGAPVADGGHLVKFVIYNAPVGGAELWNSGFQNVTTENGLFTYSLGTNVPLPDDLFTDSSRYLGITVGVDPELTPRTRLTSSPYAYHAVRADTALVSLSLSGATQTFGSGIVVMTGFLNIIATDSINCPADGFVMVNATVGMYCNHANGDQDDVFILLMDSSFTITADQDSHSWSVPAVLPSYTTYSSLLHTHKVFTVSAGWNQFSLVGGQNPGGGTDNFSTSDAVLTLLFIPQALGNVAMSTASSSTRLESLPLKTK